MRFFCVSALLELASSSCQERGGKESCASALRTLQTSSCIERVVVQKDRSTKIVSVDRKTNHRGKVESATSGAVIDSPDTTSFQSGLPLSVGEETKGSEGFDFFSALRGGLKGNSKSAHCLRANDNFGGVPMDSAKLMTEKLFKMRRFMALERKFH